MKTKTVIAALAILLSTQSVRANEPQDAPATNLETLSQDDIATAIAILVESGVIAIEDGKIVVKNPSALEQLRKSGRWNTQTSANHSICW